MKKSWLVILLLVLLPVVMINCEKDEQKINQKPTCDITSPENGFVVKYGNEFTIRANCNDKDGTVSKVEYYINGLLFQTFEGEPYTTNVKSSDFSSGEVDITAIAYDDESETAEDKVSIRIEAEYANILTLSISEVTDSSALVNCELINLGDSELTSLGVCWDSIRNPTVESNKLESDKTAGKFSVKINDIDPGVTYYARAFAINSKGVSYGEEKSFTTDALKPTITTAPVSGITDSSAVCGGNAIENGGLEVTAKGVCWNTAGEPSLSDEKSNDGTGIDEFESSMENLVPNTIYFVRAYATNSLGTSYGEIQEFRTKKSVASVEISDITDITTNSANIYGEVINDYGSSVTEKGVCWALTDSPSVLDNKIICGEGNGAFSAQMEELDPGTIYYLKAYAINEVGVSYGALWQFETQTVLPELKTSVITGITSSSAISGGEVLNNGGAEITSRGVCWNTTENPVITNFKTSDGTGIGLFQSQLNSLSPATRYYVRAYAVNEVGTAYGEQFDFTTSADKPEVSTLSLTDITSSSVIVNSEVISNNGSAITEKGVVWNSVGNPTLDDNKIENGNSEGTYSTKIMDLTPGAKYYMRAYAMNSLGVSFGAVLECTILPLLPTVATKNVIGIKHNEATCGGNVTNDGGGVITSRGVCWNKSGSPTINDSKTTSGSGLGDFTSTLSYLQSETRYYVRAWAKNSKGVAYGNQVSFTTDEYLNQPRYLYYDDGSFGSNDYAYSTASNTYFIVRFKVPYGWGDVQLTAVRISFANSSSYSRFDILYNGESRINSSDIKFPSGTTFTLLSNAIPGYNEWEEYNVSKTVTTKEFYVSIKSKNSYRLPIYIDAKDSDVGDYTSLFIDSYGNEAWLKKGHIAIRAYIIDKSDLKSGWVEADIVQVENEFPENEEKGKAIEGLQFLNLDGIEAGNN
ncbi:Ig-like domain-containing protein [Marinilabilia rubra]|uniref:Fibronectin type-III domain-containing protein n=1 Tax=Marinilabilia rubra TaxID=2162893 RepID=A0A2U2B6S9_9BACT|nr:fibronectin type III domain-containing protein [Marinilabilia rubra]PWD98780.1 hypothetical protein DDZ16_13660 [Marinilabilia rubra]